MYRDTFPPTPSRIAALCANLPAAGVFSFRAYNKIARTLTPNHDVTTAFGARMHCDTRDLIQCCIRHFGVWEPNITEVFAQRVRKGGTVVDIGANIGFFTLLASKLVEAGGAVVAIEASPPIVEKLQANIELNGRENIRVLNVAVSDSEGELTLFDGPSSNIGQTTTVEGRGFKASHRVKALPLDRLLSEQEAAAVGFIKIDVEGAEGPILTNILENLALYPSLSDILVEASAHEAPELWRGLFKRMLDAGFTASGVKNRYDFGSYLFWTGAEPPVELGQLPERQLDILFSRQVPPAQRLSRAH